MTVNRWRIVCGKDEDLSFEAETLVEVVLMYGKHVSNGHPSIISSEKGKLPDITIYKAITEPLWRKYEEK